MPDGNPILIGQANTASNPGNATTLERNENTGRTVFVARNLNDGDGILGEASGSNIGVRGRNLLGSGPGVSGTSSTGVGVRGTSTSGTGVVASGGGTGVSGVSGNGVGVRAKGPGGGVFAEGGEWTSTQPSGIGVTAYSFGRAAVFGDSVLSDGMEAHTSTRAGMRGIAGGIISSKINGVGVYGTSTVSGGAGVLGDSDRVGVCGIAGGIISSNINGVGVYGTSTVSGGAGLRGEANQAASRGVFGRNDNGGIGVQGGGFTGMLGTGGHIGVFGVCTNPDPALDNFAGVFDGGIDVFNGPKNFRIDHPLDPENRYLSHTCVESSEMKNVYDGVAHLDEDGSAWVELPEWFEALNGDFRYQLTAVGSPAPNLHVAEEIYENRFKIAGGQGGMKVCWQVTGSRKDPWAAANPFEVEQEKREEDRGRYLDPSLYDAPEEQRVMIVPIEEAVEEEQRPPQPPGIDFAHLEEEHRRQINELIRPVAMPPEST